MTRPIHIPPSFVRDRAVRNLLTQWRNLHLRHRVCRTRLTWRTPAAATLEKRHRKESWLVIARILTIEHTLLRWCADATHHPDLWTSRDPQATHSRWYALIRAYHRTRRTLRNRRGPRTASYALTTVPAIKRRQAALIRSIRTLERDWMVAMYSAAFPTSLCPAPLPLTPTELRPRKVKAAIRLLSTEVS